LIRSDDVLSNRIWTSVMSLSSGLSECTAWDICQSKHLPTYLRCSNYLCAVYYLYYQVSYTIHPQLTHPKSMDQTPIHIRAPPTLPFFLENSESISCKSMDFGGRNPRTTF